MKRTTPLIVTLSTVAILATVFFALDFEQTTVPWPDDSAVASESATGQGPRPGEAALRAVINPETGQVEVTTLPSNTPFNTTLDAATQRALRRDTEGLVPVIHPDGAVEVNLQGRFQNVSVARIDENGKLVICSEEKDKVHGILTGRSTATQTQLQTPEVR